MTLGVVIPAHNGSATIGRSLASLLADTGDDISIAVVCNGCRDDTADRAAAWQQDFRARGAVLEVTESAPGRAAAIAQGEAVVGDVSLLLVVDQDARLGIGSLAALRAAADRGSDFVAPQLRLPVGGTRAVAAYYRAWSRHPYVRDSPVTIGVYGVSRRGRERWTVLPADVPDDKFVRLHFRPEEREVVANSWYEPVLPSDLGSLLRARSGYERSNRALGDHRPDLAAGDDPSRRAGRGRWALEPANWPGMLIAAPVHLLARRLGTGQIASRR